MKTAVFFRSEKVRRAVIVLACIALVCGGFRLYLWAWPRIHYASLDRQEWREDMEPWEYFPPVSADAKGPPESLGIGYYLPDYSLRVDKEHLKEMIEREELLDMPDFEPECGVRYSGGSMHTVTFFWVNVGGRIVLKASPVSGGSKYEGGGGEFIPTESLEIARRPLITCRDGVDIVCAGREDEEKCMRFYKDGVWYQICGEEGISYEDMVRVLDYYFENPVYFF